MSCLQCIEACPVKNTLVISASRSAVRPVPSWVFGALVAGVFAGITGLAMLSGYWQNGMTKQEYQRRFQELDKPVYQHFRGTVPEYTPYD